MITGTVFLRDNKEYDEEHKLMLIAGVIKVPKDFEMKGECQYAICSNQLAEMGLEMPNSFSLSLSKKIFRDFSKHRSITGGHLGDIWQEPIWKV